MIRSARGPRFTATGRKIPTPGEEIIAAVFTRPAVTRKTRSAAAPPPHHNRATKPQRQMVRVLMSLNDDLTSVQRRLDDLMRCVGRLDEHAGDSLDMRRVRSAANHLRESLAL